MIPLVIVLFALFCTAGAWQVKRGQQKERLEAELGGQPTFAALHLAVETPPPDELSAPHATAEGHLDAAHQLLLDNQPNADRPGYRVWTPLSLAAGGWLIVDRGWVPADPDRARLPDLPVDDTFRKLRGTWRPLPRPGLRLAEEVCKGDAFPRIVNYPRRSELTCILGGNVADGILLLDPAEPDGFVREWTKTDSFPPSRHYGYAAQWFAFAATLLFVFFRFGFTRTPSP